MVSPLHDPLPVPPQDVVPTLHDLSLLPVPNWYLLGLQLGVSGDELDVVERNYPRDNHMCKVKMFGTWLRMDTSGSYRKLARALVTLGKRNIAEAMCTARGMKYLFRGKLDFHESAHARVKSANIYILVCSSAVIIL